MPEIQTIKISELPETSNLNGLKTLGTTSDNQSVAAQLQAVADATTNANDAATQAQAAAQTANQAAQTANNAAASANQATDSVIDAINKTEAAYINATAAAESANEAADAANSAANQAIGFINSAQTAVDSANTAANDANEAATTATDAANNANTQAEYAKEQGDYAKQQGDAVLAQKGQPNGLAELDETGRVPSSQLPSYVDDVIDVDTYSNLPNPGESGKIYITTDNNKQYRWSGTGYAEISSSLALGETSSTAYRGDRGKVAYEHSQIKSGNPHGTTFASLPDKPTSLPANGGNADTVDGLHSSDFARATQTPYVDINTINDRGITGIGETAQATAERHYPIQEAGALFYSRSANYSANQIYGTFSSNRWFVRGGGNGPSEKTPWAEIWTTLNLTKLSQLQDDVVSGNYFKLSANRVSNLNDTPINSFFVSALGPSYSPVSYASFVNGFCFAADNNSSYKRQLVYADDWYGRTQNVGTWGGWYKFWHSGNFLPNYKFDNFGVTLDSKNEVGNGYTLTESGASFSGPFLKWGRPDYMFEFYSPNDISNVYLRNMLDGDWQNPVKLWHSGNLNPDDKLGVNAAAAAIKDTSNNSSKKIWTGTQSEYDAISTKDSNTIYFIV